jgi:hypothetical protein
MSPFTLTVVVPELVLYLPDTPLYVAVIVFAPAASDVPATVNCAVPAVLDEVVNVTVPSVALFVVSTNVTLPESGVVPYSAAAVTVAVSTVDAVGAMLVGFALTLVVVLSGFDAVTVKAVPVLVALV